MGAICLHCHISGQVQGVFFRQHTHDQAKARGITGWVRNLPDGRVEAMLCGEKEKLDDMLDWLKEGPERAEVSDVEIKEVPHDSELTEFEVRR